MKYAIFDFDGTLFDSMFVWETLGEDFLRPFLGTPRIYQRQGAPGVCAGGILDFVGHLQDNLGIPEKLRCSLKFAQIFSDVNARHGSSPLRM